MCAKNTESCLLQMASLNSSWAGSMPLAVPPRRLTKGGQCTMFLQLLWGQEL